MGSIILARFAIIVFLLGSILLFNRCIYVGALLMGIEEKKTVDKWKSGKYKTRIQRRLGWAGPPYYQCRVKVKRLGGLYYRTIGKKTFSYQVYSTFMIKYPFHKDTIAVNIYKKNTYLIK